MVLRRVYMDIIQISGLELWASILIGIVAQHLEPKP